MCQSQVHPPRSNKLPAHAKVHYINDEPASSDESIYALDPLSDRKHYYANIHVSPLGGQKALTLKFQIDTGASCSTLALVDYKLLTTAPLQPSHIKLKLYDNSILQPLGAVTLWCEANNTQVIADDTIIYGPGENDAEADKSHDTAFRALIERCREKGLKLNPKKLNFKQTPVSYMGHIFSAQGLAADPEKVKAVSQMQCPTNVQGVQRVLGVANYLAKFTPKLSTVSEPLQRLLDKDSVFDWLPQHETAFSRMKELITQAPVLQYYDVNKEVSLECDSSEVGLGAVIKQGGHPIAYASRALTKTEQNYAQIEKKYLVIVFAAERFEQYILGKEKVKVFSDHKPLETIL